MAGANEQKLREHLAGSRVWQVVTAEFQWSQGEQALAKVARRIEEARPLAQRNLGRHTADRADEAFVAMHAKVKERQEQLKKGTEALREAKAAITRAEAVVRGFDSAGPIDEPTPPDWSEDEIDQIQQLKVHGARMNAYNNAVAEREQAALAAIQDVDATNQASTATMREIQGKRPADPAGDGGGGAPGGGGGLPPRTGGTPPRYDDPPTYDPPTNPTWDPPTGNPTQDPPTFDPPTFDPPTGGTVEPPTGETGPGDPPVLTTPPSGSFGGMAGAIGGGLAGGAIGMGAIRAGALGGVGPAAASDARPIGSTGRTGASGALGRSAAVGGTATRGTAGRAGAAGGGAGAGAGRGAAGRGAGSRAGAGRAGAGGAGGRGGRQGKDDKQAEVEHLLDDHDWIDDEDAAPSVID